MDLYQYLNGNDVFFCKWSFGDETFHVFSFNTKLINGFKREDVSRCTNGDNVRVFCEFLICNWTKEFAYYYKI